MRQERQRPFCTSVYRQAILDLLVQASGAEHECQPPHGPTARVPSAAECTVSVCKPIQVPAGNTRARSSLWILDSANRHHIASARLQAGAMPQSKQMLLRLCTSGYRSSNADSSSSGRTRLAAATRYNQLDVSSPSNGLGAKASSAGAKSIGARIKILKWPRFRVFRLPYAAYVDRRWTQGWR